MEELVFDVCAQKIAAKRWNKGAERKALALHGWLDNCASFDFLAPLLTDIEIVALDMAGHGQSCHRGFLGAYNIWQDIPEVLDVARQLQWPQFSLIGHSRGAIIATLIGACCPEKVENLVLVDGLLPDPVPAESAPEQLALSSTNLSVAYKRIPTYYQTYEDAVSSRMCGFTPLCRADAQALAKRGVSLSDSGFYWSYDSKLTAPSEVKFSLVQLQAFAAKVEAPMLLVLASEAFEAKLQKFAQYSDLFNSMTLVELTGYHHLQMSTQCDAVAKQIDSFLDCVGG